VGLGLAVETVASQDMLPVGWVHPDTDQLNHGL